MIGVLRPTGNAIVADAIDVATQLTDSFVGQDQPGAQCDPLPYRFDLVAVFQTRGAVLRGAGHRLGIKRRIVVSVVEYAAAIVVDKALRQRPLGDDHIVSVELDVEIVHLVGALSLYDRGAINEVLGFDQHAVDVHGVVRRNPEVASRHMVFQARRP